MHHPIAFTLALLVAAGAVLGARPATPGARPTTSPSDPIVGVEARLETPPMPHAGDSADDPAIWIHPVDDHKSLILGTDKQGGLHVYDTDGTPLQLASDGCRPNNVDVLYGFVLDGRKVDLAVASVRRPKAEGVKVWRIDPDARRLIDITSNGVIPVLDRTAPYGICTYRSARDGRCYFFVNNYDGRVEQYQLTDAGAGRVGAGKVRAFELGSIVEGCVADDELGFFYVAQEQVGIWKYGAEPDAGQKRVCVARIGEHGLARDIEGLAIYYASGGRGYLIASSQGNNQFKVYRREGDNAFLLTIDPKAGTIDDVSDTDGIAVTNRGISPRFPRGMFIVQDGSNEKENQNFKLYDWQEIAGQRLIIDTIWAPR